MPSFGGAGGVSFGPEETWNLPAGGASDGSDDGVLTIPNGVWVWVNYSSTNVHLYVTEEDGSPRRESGAGVGTPIASDGVEFTIGGKTHSIVHFRNRSTSAHTVVMRRVNIL